MALYVDGAEGVGGAEVLASSATNALCLVDSGDHHRHLIIGIKWFHLNGSSRTVAFAVAAFYSVGNGNTVLFNPYGMSDLCA